jgi:hypothetical protein
MQAILLTFVPFYFLLFAFIFYLLLFSATYAESAWLYAQARAARGAQPDSRGLTGPEGKGF